MNWQKLPIGMIRLDELLNILNALALADIDPRALAIVAVATGLGEYYQPAPQCFTVEIPDLVKDDPPSP